MRTLTLRHQSLRAPGCLTDSNPKCLRECVVTVTTMTLVGMMGLSDPGWRERRGRRSDDDDDNDDDDDDNGVL